jgi:hypothetical protein
VDAEYFFIISHLDFGIFKNLSTGAECHEFILYLFGTGSQVFSEVTNQQYLKNLHDQ